MVAGRSQYQLGRFSDFFFRIDRDDRFSLSESIVTIDFLVETCSFCDFQWRRWRSTAIEEMSKCNPLIHIRKD